MRTLATRHRIRTEQTIKRSRFLTTLARVDDEDAARALIGEVRKEFADARHNCTAFVVRAGEAAPISRSSDDGEPAGTAGMPMLDTLTGADLVDVVAVVTRYFGGIKLGTGGLVRAYAGAVAAAIDAADLVEIRTLATARLDVPLAQAGPVEAALRERDALILESQWTHALSLSLAGTPDQLAHYEALAGEISRGQTRFHLEGTHPVEEPVRS